MKNDLVLIADQIRGLLDPWKGEDYALEMAGRLVCEAIKLSAFSGPEWCLFRQYWDVSRYHMTKRPHETATLMAVRWLAENHDAKWYVSEAPNYVTDPRRATENLPLLADLIERQDGPPKKRNGKRGRKSNLPRNLAWLEEFESYGEGGITEAKFAEQKGVSRGTMNKALKQAREARDAGIC